ncbi:Rrf2 family transcriptional regulator [Hyphomicrobium sp. LHD-15]|uniref:RrF2 family transcriptional regulator n=1 Tax=Hyphomicrobium sp. LHD-15 TaxID=3072142 RepID=UPI00280CEDCF|nr:Rrf2 family transcriptional regulator [Hyphomicrobium sp. LHD-15]MDQ8698084.1 Rrf2 family transcriptional regulator [Hyphomicrobium sp. LHD-15]
MRLSKTTNYAIRILLDCAVANPNLVKVAEISERRDITLQNTFKIVHLLSRAGFIQAVRGRHGGVRLARPAAEIRIGEVVRAMEILNLEIETDEGEQTTAQGQLAALDQLFDNALGAFISVLDEHTLEQMIKVQRKDVSGSRAKAQKAPRRTKSAAVAGAAARRHSA